MGIDFAAAEDLPTETEQNARQGEATMNSTAATDSESLKISGGGGSDAQRSIDEVIQKSQNDLTKVRQIIGQGGFTGAEKDKYTMSLHHAEWVHSRNLYMKCDHNIQEKSVKYTALVNGKAEDHKIVKAYKEWTDTRKKCQTSSADLTEKANQYIETDRRVRANKKAEEDIYPTIGQPEPFMVRHGGGVEGFGVGEVREGFDFYNGATAGEANSDVVVASGTTPAVKTFNARLPLLTDNSNLNTAATAILPWGEYYTQCSSQALDKQALCNASNVEKNKLINTINILFDRADRLINVYYKLKNDNNANDAVTAALEISGSKQVGQIQENQKKNIALHKQNALYDYDEYNSLSFYEDLVGFLYYAVFVIFLVMSLRDFFSSASGAYDKRNIIILILLGIYPKYILPVVLWILNGLTKITEMLGLKNVRFWRE
jgi:hypothetical protein